jgi:phage-related baseplate assembly protein
MNKLPEPNFIDRDVNKITQEWIDLYEEKTGKTLYPAQIERILIDVGVYRENLLRIAIQEAAKQNLVNFASYPMLDYLGELVGVERLKAQKAKTKIKASITEIKDFDVEIPANTVIETKDGKTGFSLLENLVIKSGSLSSDEVSAECLVSGIIGNGYLQINSLSGYDGIKVENTDISRGGADEEDDESLRARIKQAPEKFTNAGSKGAYRYWAITAHQDIIDVAVLSTTPGTVKIYPLTKSGNPSGDILLLVENILNNDKVRPLTDQVIIESPQKIDFKIQASIILYSYADLKSVETEIKAKMDKYIADLKTKLGKDIVPTQIITHLNGIYGVFKVDLNEPDFTEISEYQWANCNDYKIEVAGYTNG